MEELASSWTIQPQELESVQEPKVQSEQVLVRVQELVQLRVLAQELELELARMLEEESMPLQPC